MSKNISLKLAELELYGETLGRGPDVLLLHAGGETRHVWKPVVSGNLQDNYCCTFFDQRGHGESGGQAIDGLSAYSEDADAMIELTHKPVVVGASLGGFALMLALEKIQDRVAGLVLVDVIPAPDPKLTKSYLAPRGDQHTFPLIEDILSRADVLSRIVGNLRLPIMLICGGRSPITSTARKEFQSLVPHAQIEMIESAGHLVARDAPLELSYHLSKFMEDDNVRVRR